MSRSRKKKQAPFSTHGWLITFSDLMTLLLTFFVLLLSMSIMNTPLITRISAYFSGSDAGRQEMAGRIPQRIQEIVAIIRDPDNVFLKQERLKDLLFPHDLLPPEIPPGDLEKNLRILEHPEGVVIVLTEGLLFPSGQRALSGPGKILLDLLSPVILAVDSDVNISGHADPVESRGKNAFALSGDRALAVLAHFLHNKITPNRFSLSGYGADKPMEKNTTKEGRAMNRRVEILLKTTKWLSGYN